MGSEGVNREATPHTCDEARRGFIARAMLAGGGGCLAALMSGVGHTAQPARQNCSAVTTPLRDVEGKVVFITGGSSGIGLGIARACSDAGMKVAIGYRTQRNADQAMSLLAGAGSRAHPVEVDVTDRRGMEQAAAETVKVFGKVHALVNNAGVVADTPLSKATYDDWDWLFSVNLTGVFNGVRAFLPHIVIHGEGGQIVTTSSILGLVSGGAGLGIYSATKFAAVGLMEALRADLAGMNIGASVFCPGFVKTNLGNASRNRPNELATTASKPMNAQQRGELDKDLARSGDWGMDPLEAGRLVLRGIRNNDLYILTHPEFEQGILDRNEALIASIPRGVNPPKERVTAERQILSNPVYRAESDRKRCAD